MLNDDFRHYCDMYNEMISRDGSFFRQNYVWVMSRHEFDRLFDEFLSNEPLGIDIETVKFFDCPILINDNFIKADLLVELKC